MKNQPNAKNLAIAIDGLKTFLQQVPKDSDLFKGAVNGINQAMQIECHTYGEDPFKMESLLAELLVQEAMKGFHYEEADIAPLFTHDYWTKKVMTYMIK